MLYGEREINNLEGGIRPETSLSIRYSGIRRQIKSTRAGVNRRSIIFAVISLARAAGGNILGIYKERHVAQNNARNPVSARIPKTTPRQYALA